MAAGAAGVGGPRVRSVPAAAAAAVRRRGAQGCTPGGPLNKERGGVKAYGERAEANPSSTNLAVHGGDTPWGTGPGFPGQSDHHAGETNLLNADADPQNLRKYVFLLAQFMRFRVS